MQKVPFILKELSILKIPGFPRGLEPYKNLSPYINIIAGPNASGKSSTARTINQVIWQNQTHGIQVESSAEIDQEHWDIKIDSTNIKLQRDGKDDEFSSLPAVETSERYMLALHELVVEDEVKLARQIVKESIGGFDLEEAQKKLEYAAEIKSKRTTEFKNYVEADKKYKEIQRQQKSLKKEEDSLDQLSNDKEKAENALKLKDLFEKVTEYLTEKSKFDQISTEYKAYPEEMNNVSGDEYNTIEELEKEIENTDQDMANAEKEIKKHEDTLLKLQLPKEGVSAKVLNDLEKRVERLADIEREINDKERKIEEFQAKAYEALKSIDESIDTSAWKGIKLEEVSGLDEFFQKAYQTISQKQFLETEITQLQEELSDKKVQKTDVIIEGIRSLSYWLQEQSSTLGIEKKWIITFAVIGIAAVITAFALRWFEIGTALVIILAFGAYITIPSKKNKVREQDYQKTGLQIPTEWNTNEVMQTLEALVDHLKETKWQEKINQQIESRTLQIESLEEQLIKINKTRDEWIKKLQLMPDLSQDRIKNLSSLYWFLTYIKEWQKNHAEVEALRKNMEQLSKDKRENFKKINNLFNEFNAKISEDLIEAKTILRKLKEDEETRRNAKTEIEHQNEQIKEKQKYKDRNIKKLQEIYKKLNVEYDQKDKVRQLIEQHEEFKKAKNKYLLAENMLTEKERLMKDHSLFESNSKEIENLSIDEAKLKLEEFENESRKLEDIKTNITEIELNIKSTKQSNDLEDALAEKEDALINLETLYENNLSSITGKIIIDQLKKETREKNRPKVFIRANEIFNRITHGRHELILEEKEEPAFKAYDNVLMLGQDLNELSTGTRLQLLMSIRLAFVETQESFIKLPIMADELLANSDDIRAKAIIEALIEISKEGRQIFYFTAQGDEVSKWKFFLENNTDISYKIIELTGRYNETIEYNRHEPAFSFIDLITDIPHPVNKSHENYGKLLNVPSYNILTEKPGQLHLWYLLEDNNLLYICLKRGLMFWGQLDSFIRHNGKIEELGEKTITQIQNKIKILENFQELYRRGRPRPINREILEHSGAVSDSFIDEVSSKLIELKGNPKELIQTLRNGEISGFRQSKIDELEQFLFEEEYLDNQKPLEKEEIIVHLNAIISNMDMNITDAESFINGIL